MAENDKINIDRSKKTIGLTFQVPPRFGGGE